MNEKIYRQDVNLLWAHREMKNPKGCDDKQRYGCFFGNVQYEQTLDDLLTDGPMKCDECGATLSVIGVYYRGSDLVDAEEVREREDALREALNPVNDAWEACEKARVQAEASRKSRDEEDFAAKLRETHDALDAALPDVRMNLLDY